MYLWHQARSIRQFWRKAFFSYDCRTFPVCLCSLHTQFHQVNLKHSAYYLFVRLSFDECFNDIGGIFWTNDCCFCLMQRNTLLFAFVCLFFIDIYDFSKLAFNVINFKRIFWVKKLVVQQSYFSSDGLNDIAWKVRYTFFDI